MVPLDNFSVCPARQELAALNQQLAEASAARDAAQESYDRLERPTRLLADVSGEYAAEKALYDAAIVVWYESGCPGVRPDVPSPMLEFERQLGDLRRDLGASATALEFAASGLRAANEHLAELHARHRGALYRAAVEAAEWRLHTRAIPALIAALAEFGVVESLEVELRNRGFGPDPQPEALPASREIGRLLTVVRQSTGVRGNLERARQFLNELAANPDLELPDPGEPIIEHLEVRIPKPPEDGSQFINRGNPEAEVPAAARWPVGCDERPI